MLIKDWMAKNVIAIDESESLMKAIRIMETNQIRKLPVVLDGKLKGIISDRDVKDASPPKNTTLDIHELYYLLSEIKVKDMMTKDPITMLCTDSLEKAAMIMLENKISGIPVLDDFGKLSGLISETDVMHGFIHATGITNDAIQYVFDLPDATGSVNSVVEVIRKNEGRVVSILTSFSDVAEGMKQVAIRVTLPKGTPEDGLTQKLSENFSLVFHAKDDLANLPKKRSLRD